MSLSPDSEEVEKLWKVYQLAKKRKLSKLADAKLEELVSKHPDTSRGWQARMEKLRRRLEQGDPDSTALGESNILLERYPRHPEAVRLREHLRETLLDRAGRRQAVAEFEAAESDYEAALRYGADPGLVAGRREALRQARIQNLLTQGDQAVVARQFGQAEGFYADAAGLGASENLIRKRRLGIRIAKVRALIEDGRFEHAGEELVLWEASGEDPQVLPKLNAFLRKQRTDARANEVRELIKKGDLLLASEKLVEWELTGEDLDPLPELYVELEKGNIASEERRLAEEKRISERRKRVRQLVENKKFW